MSPPHRFATLLLVCAGLGAAVAAQPSSTPPAAGEPGLFVVEPEGPCEELHPTVFGDSGLWLLRSGRILCRGQWAWAVYLNEWDRRVTGIPGREPVWNSWDLDWRRDSVAVGYGVVDGVELSLMLPYDAYDGSGPVQVLGDQRLVQGGRLHGREVFERIDAGGFGNARLGARFRLAEHRGWAWASHLFVELPTGDYDEAVATEGPGLGFGLAWSLGSWVVNAGFYDPGDPATGAEADQLQLGIGHRRDLGERLQWITELAGNLKTSDFDEHDEADLTTGVRWWPAANRRLAVNAALRVDLSQGDGLADGYNPVGWLVGVSWAPSRWQPLDVEMVGECRGTVVRQPAPARCAPRGSPRYLCGQVVRLTAIPDDEGCGFAGWGGDCAGREPILDLRVEGETACTARFEPLPADPGRGAGEAAAAASNEATEEPPR